MTIRVVIVDDQDMVRSGFAALLSAQSDIDVAGEAPHGRLGIEVCRSTHPSRCCAHGRPHAGAGRTAGCRRLLDPPPVVVHRPKVLMLTTSSPSRKGTADLRGRFPRRCTAFASCMCTASRLLPSPSVFLQKEDGGD